MKPPLDMLALSEKLKAAAEKAASARHKIEFYVYDASPGSDEQPSLVVRGDTHGAGHSRMMPLVLLFQRPEALDETIEYVLTVLDR